MKLTENPKIKGISSNTLRMLKRDRTLIDAKILELKQKHQFVFKITKI